jgi:hypothetical protein
MKKITKNKLQLDRQTIAVLSTSQLLEAAGGQRPATKATQCADQGCSGTIPTQLGLC